MEQTYATFNSKLISKRPSLSISEIQIRNTSNKIKEIEVDPFVCKL